MQLLHFVRSYGMLYMVKCSSIVSDVACAGGVSPVRLNPSKSAPTAGIAALSYNRISSVVLPSPSGSTAAACAQLCWQPFSAVPRCHVSEALYICLPLQMSCSRPTVPMI